MVSCSLFTRSWGETVCKIYDWNPKFRFDRSHPNLPIFSIWFCKAITTITLLGDLWSFYLWKERNESLLYLPWSPFNWFAQPDEKRQPQPSIWSNGRWNYWASLSNGIESAGRHGMGSIRERNGNNIRWKGSSFKRKQKYGRMHRNRIHYIIPNINNRKQGERFEICQTLR